jgi:hypothetical protein
MRIAAGSILYHNRTGTKMVQIPEPDKDGWIAIELEQTIFPPWCCDCGAPTLDRQRFRAIHNTGVVWIFVHVCGDCQTVYRRKFRRHFWKPLLITLCAMAVLGFALGTIPSISGRDPKSFPILPILASITLPLLSLPIAWFAFKGRALKVAPPPIEFRRYVRNRKLTLRFRNTEFLTDYLNYLKATVRRSAETTPGPSTE